jgi:mRNA interferase RelE/StbE
VKYNVSLSPAARKQLNSIRNPEASRIIAELFSLEQNPRPAGCIKLMSFNYYRVRVGDFRIIFEIRDVERLVVVTKIARRSEDTYRDLE